MKLLFVSAALFVAGTLCAQETSHLAVSGGAGFTAPVGTTGRNLDYGWNIAGGVGFNLNSYLGVMADLNYTSMGINNATLTSLGYGGGNLNVFSATLDPVVHLNPRGRVDVYLIGGGGLYHCYQEFTQPTVAVGTVFNPFFGFYPVAFPANQVVASYSVNKPGVNGGMGIAFGSKWHGKFFAEARYHRIFMNGSHTDYLPITFGFRR